MSNPDDDRTNWYQIHGADFFWYEVSNRNNNYSYYNIVVEYANLNSFSGERGNMFGLDKNERCTHNFRLIYDDGS